MTRLNDDLDLLIPKNSAIRDVLIKKGGGPDFNNAPEDPSTTKQGPPQRINGFSWDWPLRDLLAFVNWYITMIRKGSAFEADLVEYLIERVKRAEGKK